MRSCSKWLVHAFALALCAGCVGHIRDQPGAPRDAAVSDVIRTDTTPRDVSNESNCAAGLTSCAGRCVAFASDPANCGSCGHACASGQVCSGGACSATCSGTMCGGQCVDTQTDAMNCGACGTACATGATCASGACTTPCAGTMCGANCVDTMTDPANCGGCGQACASGGACAGGACSCPAGAMNCGGACTNTSTDPMNCGACGTACSAGMSCANGTCTGGGACPGPPAGVSADAAAALMLENQVRTAMGVPCATMVTTANTSADRHCNYYLANVSISMCVANPHVEVSGCSMYVGMNFWDRMAAAGYSGSPAFEDMHFIGNGASAVQGWIDSVWHRTPVLSPWVRDIGYGGGGGHPCDTMDFGVGASTPDTIVAMYPYANQTGLPTSFNGNYEGPPPPAPPGGWPSGYPIHVYIRNGSVSAHTLTVDGSSTAIAHVWLAPGDPAAMGLLSDEYVMYANTPLSSATRYHVTIVGTNSAGAVNLDWTFTTQ